MFHHALVAIDFSPASQPLQECVVNLQHLGINEVTLAYVIDMSYPGGSGIAHREHYENMLAEYQAQLASETLTIHTEVVSGYPPVELLNLAEQRGASMIVIGSRGHNVARELLLGSVASEVVERATLPVLLIRVNLAWDADTETPYCELACEDLLKHILFITDFSETADRAFAHVEALAPQGLNQVTLLHVQDKVRIDKYLADRLDEFNRIDHKRMENLRQRLLAKGVQDVHIEICYGSPADKILDQMDAEQYSMVVMGSQGRGFVSRVFLGSVSHRIVRESHIPVLLVPAKAAR
jgi:nucleotide-binding universal stress UspA family protein